MSQMWRGYELGGIDPPKRSPVMVPRPSIYPGLRPEPFLHGKTTVRYPPPEWMVLASLLWSVYATVWPLMYVWLDHVDLATYASMPVTGFIFGLMRRRKM